MPETAPRYIVRDKNDRAWGPFDDYAEARAWAQQKWPDVPEYDDCDGEGEFWEIEELKDPQS